MHFENRRDRSPGILGRTPRDNLGKNPMAAVALYSFPSLFFTLLFGLFLRSQGLFRAEPRLFRAGSNRVAHLWQREFPVLQPHRWKPLHPTQQHLVGEWCSDPCYRTMRRFCQSKNRAIILICVAPYQHTPIHRSDTSNKSRIHGELSLPFAMSTYLPLDATKCKNQPVLTGRFP